MTLGRIRRRKAQLPKLNGPSNRVATLAGQGEAGRWGGGPGGHRLAIGIFILTVFDPSDGVVVIVALLRAEIVVHRRRGPAQARLKI